MGNISGRLIFLTLILFQLLVIKGSCQGQNKDSIHYVRIDGPGSHSLSQKNSPLFIITANRKHLQLPQNSNLTDTTIVADISWLKLELIKSVNILKGTDATAKYDSLGKNGVVLIELKSGSLSKIPRKIRKKFSKGKK